jgi:hypothetical protein
MKAEVIFLLSAIAFTFTSCNDSGTGSVISTQITQDENVPSKAASGPLYFPFNGNANDESGNNYHGVVNGAVLGADRFGRANRAYAFNGVSSFINVGTGRLLNPTGSMTVSVWIKYNGGSYYRDIVSRWDVVDGVDERTYVLDVNPENRLGFWISPDGGHYTATNIVDPTPLSVTGSWVHVVGTWDGGTMRLFKNGTQVAKGLVSSMRTSPNTRTGIGATLGRSVDPAIAFFNGMIDDLRLYNRALSQIEILALYRESETVMTDELEVGVMTK